MLNYELIPSTEKRSKRLFIVLHGLGDSSKGLRWLPAALGLSWLNYLLVNGPDSYYAGHSWYDFSENAATGISRSSELLLRLLRDQEDAGFTPDNTVLGGFSQGCLMSLEVGLRYPRKFAGIVGISGYLNDPVRLLGELSPVARAQRILMTHGTADALVPFRQVKMQVRQLREAGLDIEWHELNKAHTIAGEEELGLIRNFIEGGFPDGTG
jgi:phospholipase/carboxylesterase